MIETGCYIDNSGGVYTPQGIVERLESLCIELGDEDGYSDAELTDDPQELHEIEEELIDRINDALPDHLVMTVGEIEPGVYLIRELEV